MKNFVCLIILFLFFPFTLYAEDTLDLYPLDNKAQVSQFRHMLESLRCLVCQNQNLADSQAPLAKDLKQKVYMLVKRGQSDDEILHYMTKRYGDFILFNPPVKWITYCLWFAPLLFALLGCIIFRCSCNRKAVC